jgi:hypothetical protein
MYKKIFIVGLLMLMGSIIFIGYNFLQIFTSFERMQKGIIPNEGIFHKFSNHIYGIGGVTAGSIAMIIAKFMKKAAEKGLSVIDMILSHNDKVTEINNETIINGDGNNVGNGNNSEIR